MSTELKNVQSDISKLEAQLEKDRERLAEIIDNLDEKGELDPLHLKSAHNLFTSAMKPWT